MTIYTIDRITLTRCASAARALSPRAEPFAVVLAVATELHALVALLPSLLDAQATQRGGAIVLGPLHAAYQRMIANASDPSEAPYRETIRALLSAADAVDHAEAARRFVLFCIEALLQPR